MSILLCFCRSTEHNHLLCCFARARVATKTDFRRTTEVTAAFFNIRPYAQTAMKPATVQRLKNRSNSCTVSIGSSHTVKRVGIKKLCKSSIQLCIRDLFHCRSRAWTKKQGSGRRAVPEHNTLVYIPCRPQPLFPAVADYRPYQRCQHGAAAVHRHQETAHG